MSEPAVATFGVTRMPPVLKLVVELSVTERAWFWLKRKVVVVPLAASVVSVPVAMSAFPESVEAVLLV